MVKCFCFESFENKWGALQVTLPSSPSSTCAGLKAPHHLITKTHREGSGQRGESHVPDQRLPAGTRDVRDAHQLQGGEKRLDGPHPKGGREVCGPMSTPLAILPLALLVDQLAVTLKCLRELETAGRQETPLPILPLVPPWCFIHPSSKGDRWLLSSSI